MTDSLLLRAYEVVHHDAGCPSIGGNGDGDCKCDAVPFLRDLKTALEAGAGGVVGFNAWWSASKYTQVIYAPEWTQQIARDGWNAALAAAPKASEAARSDNPILWRVAGGAWTDIRDCLQPCNGAIEYAYAGPTPQADPAPSVAEALADWLESTLTVAETASGQHNRRRERDRNAIVALLRDHARTVAAQNAEIARLASAVVHEHRVAQAEKANIHAALEAAEQRAEAMAGLYARLRDQIDSLAADYLNPLFPTLSNEQTAVNLRALLRDGLAAQEGAE